MKKILFLSLLFLLSCSKDETSDENKSFFTDDNRNFYMGFSTWPYALTTQAYNDTYQFINRNSDIYEEIISPKIPWDAWINNTALPAEFTNEVYRCVNHKIPGKKLVLSVSVLSIFKNDLAPDYNGYIPTYTYFSDSEIENAYFKHLKYLIEMLQPQYLIYGIEMNELYIRNPSQWPYYKILMNHIRQRLKTEFPDLPIAESISLHSLYLSPLSNASNYQNEIFNYANQMDFVPISFYPFFNDLKTSGEFHAAFDFLLSHINKPIAISETGMNAENIDVDVYNFHRTGDENRQNEYLKSLLLIAQEHQFEFIIWWTHRDYYETWQALPSEIQNLAKIYLSCGLVKNNGTYRPVYNSWKEVESIPKKIN